MCPNHNTIITPEASSSINKADGGALVDFAAQQRLQLAQLRFPIYELRRLPAIGRMHLLNKLHLRRYADLLTLNAEDETWNTIRLSLCLSCLYFYRNFRAAGKLTRITSLITLAMSPLSKYEIIAALGVIRSAGGIE